MKQTLLLLSIFYVSPAGNIQLLTVNRTVHAAKPYGFGLRNIKKRVGLYKKDKPEKYTETFRILFGDIINKRT